MDMTWAVAAAAIVTKTFYEDAKLTRPMHAIAAQRISLFLVIMQKLTIEGTINKKVRIDNILQAAVCQLA
jgi:hypothetical protein